MQLISGIILLIGFCILAYGIYTILKDEEQIENKLGEIEGTLREIEHNTRKRG